MSKGTSKKTNRPSRRKFLGMSAGVGACLFGPPGLLWAGEHGGCRPEEGDSPLLITIDAKGGWDPTISCDPVIHPDYSPFLAEHILGDDANPYAPVMVQDGVPMPYLVGPGDEDFFAKHGSDLLVVNGVDTRTNAHEIGARHTWSGASRPGYPSLGAIWATKLQLDRGERAPLAYISTGGFDSALGLVGVARAGSVGALVDIARPFWTPTGRTSERRLFHAEAEDGLRAWQRDRVDRQLASATVPAHRAALRAHRAAQSGELLLGDFAPCLLGDSAVAQPGSFYSGWPLIESAHSVVAAMAAGLCFAGRLSLTGFDTHDQHDDLTVNGPRENVKGHRRRLEILYQLIDYTVELLRQTGLWERTTIVVGSDFGRTRYNSDSPLARGKNHWPVTSMMLMGAGVRGGRRVGGTILDPEDRYAGTLARTVEVQNGELRTVDFGSGFVLRPAHVHDAVRRLVGLDEEDAQDPQSLSRLFAFDLSPDQRDLPII
jgi:hypothetical protein